MTQIICNVVKLNRKSGDRCKVPFEVAVNELSRKLSAKQYPSSMDVAVALGSGIPLRTTTHTFQWVKMHKGDDNSFVA